MKRIVIFGYVLLLALPAFADNYFRFFRITCDAGIPSFELERKGYWNVSHVAANHADRAAHIRSLKRLERELGLYVFDELWGYYDKPRVQFSCGSINADLMSQPFRPRADDGRILSSVRKNTRVTVSWAGNTVVREVALNSGTPIEKLRVYGDDDHNLMIEVCSNGRCVEEFTRELGVVTDEVVYDKLGEK